MVEPVERMLDLHKRLRTTETQGDREVLEREISDADREIDALVYDLYGLTEAEIALVEGRAK